MFYMDLVYLFSQWYLLSSDHADCAQCCGLNGECVLQWDQQMAACFCMVHKLKWLLHEYVTENVLQNKNM